MKRFVACAVGLSLLAAPVAAAPPTAADQVSAEYVKAHMGFLASDLLLGREAGSPGFDIAAEYVASQFRQLGLQPAGGNGSYFQPVSLLAYHPTSEGVVALKDSTGRSIPLVFGEDYLPNRNPVNGEVAASAPLVFVGYGIVAPEHGRDDYAGLDVKGKIVVVLDGAPAIFQTEERAYYRSNRQKRTWAAQRGAVGMISVDTPKGEARYPMARAKRNWDTWAMSWRGPDGKAFDVAPGALSLISLSAKAGERLFTGAPASLQQVAAAAEAPAGDPPRFALPYAIDLRYRSETKVVESKNVAALLPGSDPKLKDEVVLLSAHLDHIGVTRPVNGDAINNGALDNAAGVATTLEVARRFVQGGKPPKRSVLFLTVTGEEKGLLGAEYFARNPTVPLEKIVADVDLDMPILTYDFTDVVAFGADRSGIGPAVQRAAKRMNIALSPDALPEEGLFTRSDHYRFVEVGVPAVFLMTGFQNGGEEKFRGFLKGCYHHPCDDLSQPIDYLVGAKFARLNYEITRELTDAPKRPLWNKGDFFGEKFGKPYQRQP